MQRDRKPSPGAAAAPEICQTARPLSSSSLSSSYPLSPLQPHHVACGILVPQSGIEPVPPAVEAQSQPLDHPGRLSLFIFLLSQTSVTNSHQLSGSCWQAFWPSRRGGRLSGRQGLLAAGWTAGAGLPGGCWGASCAASAARYPQAPSLHSRASGLVFTGEAPGSSSSFLHHDEMLISLVPSPLPGDGPAEDHLN